MTERRVIRIDGIVQGVGFRPFVHSLACRHRLTGFVKNVAGCVLVEAEGEPARLDRFLEELISKRPPLSRIGHVSTESTAPQGDREFRIESSGLDRRGNVHISPDVAVCSDCLAELQDPGDRRYRYPFLNCTNCGPRLTIITAAPYDRVRTTMAPFVMCASCRAEYESPSNRRFHAQPIACPDCGPRLRLLGALGESVQAHDPLAAFAAALCAGKIGALQGLGGVHLVCDARNEAAVRELRRRKHRDEKPFAIMVASLAAAEALCRVNDDEAALLISPRSPIVLLCRREYAAEPIADAVAPGNPYVGVMLPYTPLHRLLAWEVGEIPLVMTSGNRSDEPIAYTEHDAVQRLRGIAELFLVHNRRIHIRCDDSVTRVVAGSELPVRRSRGYAPQPLTLPLCCPAPILAVGGQLKGTFALGRDDQAVLSHHLGDLDHFDAYRAFERDLALYQQLFDVRPELIAHDLHPDYASTRYAQGRAPAAQRIPVQHHHAHMASCMAENGLAGQVIGVTFDGTGLGTDGNVWGGEFLVGDYTTFRRAAHLRYVGMPGGEQAIHQPWRMAAAHLTDAGCELEVLGTGITSRSLRMAQRMLQCGLNSPLTSSMGRLFDAVASLVCKRHEVTYEGQAAMELEWLADSPAGRPAYPWGWDESDEETAGQAGEPTLIIDTRPLIRAVAEDVGAAADGGMVAARFHATVLEMTSSVCRRIRNRTGLNQVVLSGGAFMNAWLLEGAIAQLSSEGFEVYRHRLVPPNDGGLSLGQLAVAAARANAQSAKGSTTARLEQPDGAAWFYRTGPAGGTHAMDSIEQDEAPMFGSCT